MQLPSRADSRDCDYRPDRPTSATGRTKFLVAGAALATAGALVASPVMATPTLPDVQIDRIEQARVDAYGLTASWSPLNAWVDLLTKQPTAVAGSGDPMSNAGLTWQLNLLSGRASTTFNNLSAALADEDVQARFTSFLRTNASDPMTIPNALMGFQDTYGERLSAAFSGSSDSFTNAVTGIFGPRQEREPGGGLLFTAPDGHEVVLASSGSYSWYPARPGVPVPPADDLEPKMTDGVVPTVLRTLTEGKYVTVHPTTGQIVDDDYPGGVTRDIRFLDAFGDANLWFLMDVLGDQRADALDIVRIPGDFLESIGAETLARILGTSWMDWQTTTDADGNLVVVLDEDGNPKLKSNGAGWTNAGLLSRGRLGNLARALIAPQVTTILRTMEVLDDVNNALQNEDFEGAFQALVDGPAEITNAFLNGYQSPTLHGTTGAPFPGLLSPGSTVNFFLNEVPRDIATVLTMKKPTMPVQVQQANDPVINDNVAAFNVKVETGNKELTGGQNLGTNDAKVEIEKVDETKVTEVKSDSSTTTVSTKDRVKQVREQAAEKRAERAESVRKSLNQVGSSIRKGLGLPDRSKSASPGPDVSNSGDQGPGGNTGPAPSGGNDPS